MEADGGSLPVRKALGGQGGLAYRPGSYLSANASPVLRRKGILCIVITAADVQMWPMLVDVSVTL